MTTLEQVTGGIETALRAIDGLRVYATPVADVEGVGAVLMPPDGDYRDSAEDDTLWVFEIWLLVPADDTVRGVKAMWPYIDRSGPKSVMAVIEANRSLGFSDVDAHVRGTRPLGVVEAGAVPKFGSALIMPVSVAGP